MIGSNGNEWADEFAQRQMRQEGKMVNGVSNRWVNEFEQMRGMEHARWANEFTQQGTLITRLSSGRMNSRSKGKCSSSNNPREER